MLMMKSAQNSAQSELIFLKLKKTSKQSNQDLEKDHDKALEYLTLVKKFQHLLQNVPTTRLKLLSSSQTYKAKQATSLFKNKEQISLSQKETSL
jgi:hypothetical protein